LGKRRILTAKGPQQGFGTTRLVVSRELQLQRAKLYYREAGLGAPLLLVHGLGASSRWWFRLFPELTSANFRVLAPDLPGFGHTSGATLTVEESARVLVEFADHLQIDKFFIAGHSMGGAIASHLAANYGGRVRRVVLIDSAGVPGVGTKTIFGRLLQPWSWCPPDFYRTMIGDIIRAGPRNVLRGIRHLQHYDVRPTLRHVRVPVLVIWGEDDALTPAAHGREIAASLADARLCTIPDTRHMPMVRRPDIVARLMIDFYNESFKEENRTAERREPGAQ
jgi:pimeloyl-ACP methyl ester carboxylesterase